MMVVSEIQFDHVKLKYDTVIYLWILLKYATQGTTFIITSNKEVLFSWPSVCRFVCKQDYTNTTG